MKRRGWFNQPYRHSLASRGIKTKVDNKIKDIDKNKLDDILEPITLADNPYIYFGDKNKDDTPIDVAYLKNYEFEEGDNPEEYLFHTTSFDNIKNIAEKGLITDADKKWDESREFTYFSEYPAYSIRWLIRHLTFTQLDDIKNKKDEIKIGLLRVPDNVMDFEFDKYGARTGYGSSFYTEDDISPEDIEIKTQIGWIPLIDFVELREEYL